MSYRVVDHTADLGIDVEAASLDELFAEAARGFADCITEVTEVRDRSRRSLSVTSPDIESLLVDWLSELLFVFETRGELFSVIDARVSGNEEKWRIVASVGGETFDGERHPLKVPIKAVTYHELSVHQIDDGWRARVIFDI